MLSWCGGTWNSWSFSDEFDAKCKIRFGVYGWEEKKEMLDLFLLLSMHKYFTLSEYDSNFELQVILCILVIFLLSQAKISLEN